MITFLKQKRCGKLKVRAVADGQEQRTGLKKSDINATTAATKLVLITTPIEATESLEIDVKDAPGSLLMVDVDEEVIVLLENDIVYEMLEIEKNIYEEYVIQEKNKNMYVLLSKAMYGNLTEVLLYYIKLSKEQK